MKTQKPKAVKNIFIVLGLITISYLILPLSEKPFVELASFEQYQPCRDNNPLSTFNKIYSKPLVLREEIKASFIIFGFEQDYYLENGLDCKLVSRFSLEEAIEMGVVEVLFFFMRRIAASTSYILFVLILYFLFKQFAILLAKNIFPTVLYSFFSSILFSPIFYSLENYIRFPHRFNASEGKEISIFIYYILNYDAHIVLFYFVIFFAICFFILSFKDLKKLNFNDINFLTYKKEKQSYKSLIDKKKVKVISKKLNPLISKTLKYLNSNSRSIVAIVFLSHLFKVLIHFFFYRETTMSRARGSTRNLISENFGYHIDMIYKERVDLFLFSTLLILLFAWFFRIKKVL